MCKRLKLLLAQDILMTGAITTAQPPNLHASTT